MQKPVAEQVYVIFPRALALIYSPDIYNRSLENQEEGPPTPAASAHCISGDRAPDFNVSTWIDLHVEYRSPGRTFHRRRWIGRYRSYRCNRADFFARFFGINDDRAREGMDTRFTG